MGIYLVKLLTFFLLFIWFFTCKHWWYHVILVLITMYSYPVIWGFSEDVYYMSRRRYPGYQSIDLFGTGFYYYILIVYLIRIKVFDRIYGIDLSEMERENISPFSPLSDKEYRKIKYSRRWMISIEDEIKEDYYVKL